MFEAKLDKAMMSNIKKENESINKEELKMDKQKIEYIKMRFPRGTKITLIYMEGEPQMQKGLTGTVEYVDDIGQVHMHWANGSSLALNLDVDKFVKA